MICERLVNISHIRCLPPIYGVYVALLNQGIRSLHIEVNVLQGSNGTFAISVPSFLFLSLLVACAIYQVRLPNIFACSASRRTLYRIHSCILRRQRHNDPGMRRGAPYSASNKHRQNFWRPLGVSQPEEHSSWSSTEPRLEGPRGFWRNRPGARLGKQRGREGQTGNGGWPYWGRIGI